MKLQISIFLIFCSISLSAQEFYKAKVVHQLAEIMNSNYVYPDKGRAMHDIVKNRLENRQYDVLALQMNLPKY